jgi:hypothetical protein
MRAKACGFFGMLPSLCFLVPCVGGVLSIKCLVSDTKLTPVRRAFLCFFLVRQLLFWLLFLFAFGCY